MTEKTRFDVIVLGAGPSGLTAAYRLSRDGARVAVVERAPRTGGLMVGIRRGDFAFDLGRKELYSRLREVHDLWTELLGDDYRVYPHHVGYLHGGRILERTRGQGGLLRGMSGEQAARMAASFLWSQVRSGPRLAQNMEDYHLLRYGRVFYDSYVRGYHEKFEGCPGRTFPAPFGDESIPRFAFVRSRIAGLFGAGPPRAAVEVDTWRQDEWRHPARGTAQIAERLEVGARAAGATFLLGAEVSSVDVEGRRAHGVVVKDAHGEREILGDSIISAMPRPLFMRLLRPAPPAALLAPPPGEVAFKKAVGLVYLMANGEPGFPHNWLEVTDLSQKVGRVVNYATWNGSMVPRGKTGLCMEYFCVEGDPVSTLTDPELLALATREAEQNGLLPRDRIFDTLVVRLPHTNAATMLRDWQLDWMRRVSGYIASLHRVYDTNRPGIDYATLAGIDAAIAARSGAPMSARSLETTHEEGPREVPATQPVGALA